MVTFLCNYPITTGEPREVLRVSADIIGEHAAIVSVRDRSGADLTRSLRFRDRCELEALAVEAFWAQVAEAECERRESDRPMLVAS